MPPLQRVSRPMVVEAFDRRIPMNQVKVRAVVFAVTRGARAAGFVDSDERRVEADLFVEPRRNVFMTVDTFVFRRSLGTIMAICTMARAAKKSVRL